LYLHLLTESMRRAYADRANFLGDPDFNEDMPVAILTSKEHAARQRASIDLDYKSESDPARFAQLYESDETTHFSIVDRDGNMVSLNYTLEYGYGSKAVVEGAGYLLNNEMGDFNARPGVTLEDGTIGTDANLIRPEQRMLSSMTPTIRAHNHQYDDADDPECHRSRHERCGSAQCGPHTSPVVTGPYAHRAQTCFPGHARSL
jgi:gamma-glutamyltranspeptidase/glutathione hydrolase